MPTKKIAGEKPHIALAKRILAEPHKLGHYFGFDLLTPLHDQWFRETWQSTEPAVTLQAHRGSYKTTALVILGILIFHAFNPELRILLVREGHDSATDAVGAIRRAMKSDKYAAFIQSLYGIDFSLTEDNDARVTTCLKKKITKEGSIQCTGLRNAITGSHFDVIVTDDIVSRADRVSPAKRKLTDDVYLEMRNNILDPGGRMINLGTPWHQQDTFRLMPKPIVYDVYTTGLFSKEYINSLRYGTETEPAMLPSLWAANYELRHVASDTALFKDATYLPDTGWDKTVPIVGHIDAKYSGRDTGAFTMMGWRHDGKIQAIGFMFKDNIQDCIPQIISLWKKYNCGTIYKEKNDDKGYTAIELQKHGVPTSSYHESNNKHVKIVNNLYPDWKKILWHRDTDPDYMAQVMEYEEGIEPDDCADSAASLICRHKAAPAPVEKKHANGIAARIKRNISPVSL